MTPKKPKKTFRYTVSFTVETSRKLTEADVEERVADVWDCAEGAPRKKVFVDSYAFSAVQDE